MYKNSQSLLIEEQKSISVERYREFLQNLLKSKSGSFINLNNWTFYFESRKLSLTVLIQTISNLTVRLYKSINRRKYLFESIEGLTKVNSLIDNSNYQ